MDGHFSSRTSIRSDGLCACRTTNDNDLIEIVISGCLYRFPFWPDQRQTDDGGGKKNGENKKEEKSSQKHRFRLVVAAAAVVSVVLVRKRLRVYSDPTWTLSRAQSIPSASAVGSNAGPRQNVQ